MTVSDTFNDALDKLSESERVELTDTFGKLQNDLSKYMREQMNALRARHPKLDKLGAIQPLVEMAAVKNALTSNLARHPLFDGNISAGAAMLETLTLDIFETIEFLLDEALGVPKKSKDPTS